MVNICMTRSAYISYKLGTVSINKEPGWKPRYSVVSLYARKHIGQSCPVSSDSQYFKLCTWSETSLIFFCHTISNLHKIWPHYTRTLDEKFAGFKGELKHLHVSNSLVCFVLGKISAHNCWGMGIGQANKRDKKLIMREWGKKIKGQRNGRAGARELL